MADFTVNSRFIVTGASSGIGKSVALLLNELGATVVAIARDQERLDAVKTKAATPEAVFLEVRDLGVDLDGLPGYVRSLAKKYGPFHGLAYCAGTFSVEPLRVVDVESLSATFAVNCFAPILMAKGFANQGANDGQGSAMAFVSSISGVSPFPGVAAYAGSKGGLIAAVRSIAKELAPAGLRANCVSPSLIKTGMAEDFPMRYAEGKYPFGLGMASDVAEMVVYLLSERARWITAQNYVIDCGSI